MGYYFYDFLGYFLIIVASIITLLAEYYVRSNHGKYKKIISKNKMSGQEVARLILDRNGLDDVYVIEISGVLTDYYDSNRKVVKLSSEVFHGNSISSIAVASHEVCHAIQDKEGYFFLRLRSFIFPVVSLGTKFAYVVLFIGLLLETMNLITLGIALVGLGLLFQLVTLPTEINASKRAQVNLKNLGYGDDTDGTRTMLVSAALTYVAGVLSSALEVIRLIKLFGDRD